MRRLRVIASAFSFMSLPLFTGCTSSRPSIEGWTGCIFENAARDVLHGETITKPAAGSFLYVYTNWQPHALQVEGRMSELEIDFPVALSAGVARELSREGRSAEFRERYGHLGSPTLVPRSLSGTVRVIASDAETTSIAVDLTAPDLIVDDDKLGPVKLRGTVKARKVASMQECYRLR